MKRVIKVRVDKINISRLCQRLSRHAVCREIVSSKSDAWGLKKFFKKSKKSVPGDWSGSGRLEMGKIRYLETRRIRIRTHTTPDRIRAVRMLGGGAHGGRRVRRVSGRFEYIIQRLRPRSACTLLKQLRGAFRLLSLSHAVSEATPPSVAGRKYICIYIIKRLRFGGVPSVPPSVPAPPTLALETSVPVPCLHPPTPTHPPTHPPARPPTQSMAWRNWF